MNEHHQIRLFSLLLASYADKRNTFSWALMIWTVTAVAFVPFMGFGANFPRSITVAVAWSAVHLLRRM
jgi:hypothetical protein